MRRRTLLVFTLLLGIILPASLSAQTLIAKLTALDALSEYFFGWSVAVSGDIAIVGADWADAGGAAYIFEKSGDSWIQTAKLTAADTQANDYFGWSVAISGDVAIVGADEEDAGGSNAGAVYIFERSGGNWIQTAKLTAADAQAGDYFGWSVAVSGDVAIVGAYYEDAGGTNAGAAYVFEKSADNWIQTAKLTASDAQAGDRFGYSVAVSGDVTIVGADLEDAGGTNAGAAYVFEKSAGNWIQTAKLTAADAHADDYFGQSVAASGDVAIVGADGEDDGGIYAGAAYIFEKSADNWIQTAKLTAADAHALNSFGQSVAVSGDVTIVGAMNESAWAPGTAYVFERSGDSWIQTAKLIAPNAETDIGFGYSVAVSGNVAIVGAFAADVGGVSAGAAYVFSLPLLPSPIGDYQLVAVSPDPNPPISSVMEGGSAWRHYRVVHPSTGAPVDVGSQVRVEKANGTLVGTISTTEQGIVSIEIASDQIGSGQVSDQEEFYVRKVNDELLEEPISFTCQIRAREHAKVWRNATMAKVGVSFLHFITPNAEVENGLLVRVLETDPATAGADEVEYILQARAGGGVDFGFQSPINVSMSDIELGYGASVGFNISGITESGFQFSLNDISEAEAIAQYCLLANGNLYFIDNVILGLFTLILDFFSGEITQAFSDAYYYDLKGATLKGGLSAHVGMGYMTPNQHYFGASFGLGVGGYAGFGTIYNLRNNQYGTYINAYGRLSGYGQAGLLFTQQLMGDNSYQELTSLLNIQAINTNKWMGQKLIENRSIVDDSWEGYETQSVIREIFGHTGYEERVTIRYEDESIHDAVLTHNHLIQNLDRFAHESTSISISNSSFSDIIYSLASTSQQLDTLGLLTKPVRYEKESSEISATDHFSVEVSIPVPAAPALSIVMGGGYSFEEYTSQLTEMGSWVNTKVLPNETYAEISSIDVSYQEVVQQVFNNLPGWLISAFSWTDLLFSGDWLGKTISTAECDTFNVGNNGSYLLLCPASSTIPPGIDTLACQSWGWWGDSPGAIPLQLNKSSNDLRKSMKQWAQETYGLDYGVGGFYQFEPLNTELLQPAMFVMTYNDEEIQGFPESALRLFYEDKENHGFRYIGGIVDTVNNTVTAEVSHLRLFTLAPKLPGGSILLNASPDSIAADGNSTCSITSGPITYNDELTPIKDGTLFTVVTDQGTIISDDVDPELEGIQVVSSSGMIAFTLRASEISGIAHVASASVDGYASGDLDIILYDLTVPDPPENVRITSDSDSVTVSWIPPDNADIAGYFIYFDDDAPGAPYSGQINGYLSPFDVGEDTSFTFYGIFDTRYYFAITSYDIVGNESDYSMETTTGTEDEVLSNIPERFQLYQNYPNPFNPLTVLCYDLPEATDARIIVYDLLGREVAQLIDARIVPGSHQVVWDGRDKEGRLLPPGIYIARLVTPGYSKSIKMVLLK